MTTRQQVRQATGRAKPLVIQRISDYLAIVQFHASTDGLEFAEIARRAKVTLGTVQRHLNGRLKRSPAATAMVGILRAFGYDVQARRT